MKPLLILKHVNNVYFSLSFGEYQTFTLIEFSLRILRQIQPMDFITVRETYLLISGLKFSFFSFLLLAHLSSINATEKTLNKKSTDS